jgi:hypothetical protein
MNIKKTQIIGMVLLVGALIIHLTGDPFYALKHNDRETNRYWYTTRVIPQNIEAWRGETFDFESWVYHFIPKASLMGLHYTDPEHSSRFIQLSVVHTNIREYLHDTNLCDYGQGIEQKLINTVMVPGSTVKASFTRLKVMESGQEFYQMSWYQWGRRESEYSFWRWLPVALGWRLFHNEPPKWHFFNLVYVDNDKPMSEEEARDGLTRFAGLLEQNVSDVPKQKTAL